MSTYKQRNDYFKLIASANKLIAHEQPIEEGSTKLRKSFHRINDEDELNASCTTWAHFPCVVHIGSDIAYTQPSEGLPRKTTANHLYFLAKASNPITPEAIEAAYEEAYTAMSQFVSYMLNEISQIDTCGELFLFDMNRAKADMIGPINSSLFGWYLSFQDEKRATEFFYNIENWLTP